MKKAVVLLGLVFLLSACGTIRQARLDSAMEEANKNEQMCKINLLNADVSECEKKFPYDADKAKSDIWYVNINRSQCMSDAFLKVSTSQPDKDLSDKIKKYSEDILSTAQQVQSHQLTNINRNAMLDEYANNNIFYHPSIVRRTIGCHTAAKASVMSYYAYPNLIVQYNSKMTLMANALADGKITLAQAQEYSIKAVAEFSEAETQNNAMQVAYDAARAQQTSQQLMMLSNQMQQNSYMQPPAMPVTTRCQNFHGTVTCTTQ